MYRCQESWSSSRVGKRSVEVMGVNVRQDIIKNNQINTKKHSPPPHLFNEALFTRPSPLDACSPNRRSLSFLLSSSPPLLSSATPSHNTSPLPPSPLWYCRFPCPPPFSPFFPPSPLPPPLSQGGCGFPSFSPYSRGTAASICLLLLLLLFLESIVICLVG